MKKWKERGKRIAVLLLTAALIGSSVDLSALTVNAAEDAAALKVNVELGGAQLLEATTITPTKPENGNGTAENPYQITSAAELYWFAGLVNGTLTDVTKNSSACAKLMNDITVNNNLLDRITYKTDEDGNLTNEVANGGNFISWTPIGAANNGYQGTFDGNGKTISGLFFNDSQKSHVGLFDNIYMATIRNVGVVDSYFFGEHYVGGVCAFGVDGTITGSYNTGVVSGEGCVGGVCGTGSSVTITDSYNTGSVSGNDDVGGVFGYGENCTINNCYYLKAEGTDLGGINGADVEGQAEGKTAAQFASGEVAYLLQDGQKVGEDGTIPQVWGQNIDNDGEKQSFPVFSNAKVYKPSESSPCKAGYTNNAEGLKEHDFGDDKTGESCSDCSIKNINYSGISISGVDTLYYYTGNEIKPDITIKKGETSLTLGEDYNITYGNNTDVAGSNAENAPYVKITGKGNYTGEITKNFTIAYITAPDNYITGTKGANDWYTSDVTIGVADWQVSTDGSSWNDSISVTEEGTHSYTLYFKDSNGYITDSINKEIKIDKAAPTGTIQVKESTWDKFLEKISFGFYTNTKEKITITSEDTGSGIASTEYLVSDKAYTQISDMQNLSGWKDYDNSNKPKIKTNRTNYVYARITDNVGNVTYLSSDGILHDDEKPYIFDITPVMKDRSGSVTFDIFEDGSGLEKVYFLYSTDINEVTSATTENLKASDYHNATGTFTLSDLKPNTEYYCAVLAVDKAGNESYLLNSTFKTLKEAITGTVSISGEAVYGKTLTASYEGLATDAGEVTVSWYRGEDTTAIATGDTYTLTADDVGKVITVKVTAENCSGELTDSTAEVAKAEHPNPPTNGNVDDENNTFTFNGTSGVTYEYSTDGGASWTDITVDSGTGVGTVTVGNVIVNTGDLQVRAKETDGYKASDVISNTSAYTATLEGSVSLSGTAKYGETLTATVTGAQQGAATIDIADKLPENRGDTTYTVTDTTDSSVILQNVAVDTAGKLTYTVISGKKVGDKANITVTAQMANYKSATFTVNISITDKIVVALKNGSSVTINGSNALTYGDKLSKLNLGKAVFVEKGTNTVVPGTLEFAAPDDVPTVGTTTAGWKFTPDDADIYVGLTGTVEISVSRATPNVTIPTVSKTNIVYDPAKTLKDYTLNGTDGTWVVGGTETSVAGTWSWKTDTTVPTVNNSGYVAVFTPDDTNNYNTVTGTITVKVTKATPVIAKNPTATALTYGQKLSDSTLTGGKVTYKTADGTEVAGTFAWKNSSIKPTVADSGKIEYDVTFTPSDTDNYNAVDMKISLTVNKATKAPNMPETAMAPAHSTKKVGDIILSEGWSWQEADKDTALADGVAVTATAVYTGADKGNYETESVSITITRSKCDHTHTEIRNQREATCKEEGYTGDTYCVECGELVESGTVIPLAKHQGGKATCIHQAVCTVCGTSYGDLDSSNHTYENGVCKDCSNIWKTTIDDITYQTVTKEENGKPAGQTVTVTVDGQNVEMLAVAVTAVDVNALSQNNSDIFANGTLTIPAKVIDDDAKQTCVVTRINSDVFVQDTEAPVISEVVIPDTVTEVGTGAFTGVATVTFEGATAPAGVKDAISEGTVVQIPDGAKDSYETALEGKGVIKELHTHQYADTWTYDAEYHWHASTCGHDAQDGVLTKEKHTFGEWKEVVAATTTEAGKKERSCVCGYKETADIPKLDVQTPETPSTPAPGTPSTPAPGTPSTPAPETPSTPVPETPAVKTPKKGDKVSDDKKTGSYIITSSEKKEVAYVAPANKNAKTITIPATIKVKGVTYKVTKIADNCFRNNKKITKITIGKNIVSIGKNAFYGCKKLKTITIRSKKLTSKTVSKNAFKGLTKITTIKVPRKKLTAYKKLLKKKGLSSKVKVKGYK